MLAIIVYYKDFFSLALILCGVVAQYVNFKHLRQKRMEPGDVGYFWRLMKAGDKDGKIVIVFSCLSLFFGITLIIALLFQ